MKKKKPAPDADGIVHISASGDRYCVSKSALASRFSIDRRKAAELLADVEPVTDYRGYPAYDLFVVALLVAEHKNLNTPSHNDQDQMPEDQRDEDYWKTRQRRNKVLEDEGQLVDRDDVAAEFHRLAKVIQQSVTSFPTTCSTKFGATPDEVSRMQALCDKLLSHIYTSVDEQYQ